MRSLNSEHWCKQTHRTFPIKNPKHSIISYSSLFIFILFLFLLLNLSHKHTVIRVHARTSLDQYACVLCLFRPAVCARASCVPATWLSHLTYIYRNQCVCVCVCAILVTNKFVVPLFLVVQSFFCPAIPLYISLLSAAIVYTLSMYLLIILLLLMTDNTLYSASAAAIVVTLQNAFRLKICHMIRTHFHAHACHCVLCVSIKSFCLLESKLCRAIFFKLTTQTHIHTCTVTYTCQQVNKSIGLKLGQHIYTTKDRVKCELIFLHCKIILSGLNFYDQKKILWWWRGKRRQRRKKHVYRHARVLWHHQSIQLKMSLEIYTPNIYANVDNNNPEIEIMKTET